MHAASRVATVGPAVLFLAALICAPELRGEDISAELAKDEVTTIGDQPDEGLCAELLTKDEVTTALGRPLDEDSPTLAAQYAEGTSTCYWTTSGAEPTAYVTLMIRQLQSIREAMDSNGSVSDFFDMNVASTTDRVGGAPEKLEDIGLRAVLFSEPGTMLVYIETPDGFAHLSSVGGVTRAQIVALAGAIAPPGKK